MHSLDGRLKISIVVDRRSKVASSTCSFPSNTSPKAEDLKERNISSAQKFKQIVIRGGFGSRTQKLKKKKKKKKDLKRSGKKLKSLYLYGYFILKF